MLQKGQKYSLTHLSFLTNSTRQIPKIIQVEYLDLILLPTCLHIISYLYMLHILCTSNNKFQRQNKHTKTYKLYIYYITSFTKYLARFITTKTYLRLEIYLSPLPSALEIYYLTTEEVI